MKRYGVNKVIFSGCVVDSLPVQYVDSLRFLGCKCDSLDLAHLSVIRTDERLIDYQIAMSSLVGPWSETAANKRCLNILENENINSIHYGPKIPFGLNLQKDEVWIGSANDSLIKEIKEMGYSLTYHSN